MLGGDKVKIGVGVGGALGGGGAGSGSSSSSSSSSVSTRRRAGGQGVGSGFDRVAAWLLGLADEDVFRKIVGFLQKKGKKVSRAAAMICGNHEVACEARFGQQLVFI